MATMSTQVSMSRLGFERKAFYTPAEIADLLQVHVSTVRDWIHADRLFAYQLSERVYRVPLSALMELLGDRDAGTRRELSAEEADRVWSEISNEHRGAARRA
jgi:excisionase family DNA binding protein